MRIKYLAVMLVLASGLGAQGLQKYSCTRKSGWWIFKVCAESTLVQPKAAAPIPAVAKTPVPDTAVKAANASRDTSQPVVQTERYALLNGGPLIFGNSVSKPRLVEAMRTCDHQVLRPPCSEIMQAAKQLHPSLGTGDMHQLADYLSVLTERDCPNGARIKSTEWVPTGNGEPGRLILGYGYWDCSQSHERLLWDDGRPVVSLQDGNFVASYLPSSSVRLAAAAVVDTPPARRATSSRRIPISKDELPPRVVTGSPGPQGPEGPVGPQGPQGPPGQVVRVGHNPWPWIIGGLLLAGGGTAYYCSTHHGCRSGGTDISNTNINTVNGMTVGIGRAGIRIPFP